MKAYGFAAACFLLAFAAYSAFGTIDSEASPFRVYFPAVLIATLVGGARAGATVAVLGMIVGWDRTAEPSFALNLPRLPQAVDLFYFGLTSAAVVWIAESYRVILRGGYERGRPQPPSKAWNRLKQALGFLAPGFRRKPAAPKPAAKRIEIATAPQNSDTSQLARTIDDPSGRYSNQILEAFAGLIPRDRPAALIALGDPLAGGEAAMWLGEIALLSRLGISPSYRCVPDHYDRSVMANALEGGTILVHGKAFASHDWRSREFLLRLIQDFPDNKIVIFPQQVTDRDVANLQRAADSLAVHSDLTVFTASAIAHHLMTRHSGVSRLRMAPDMAFMLAKQEAISDPVYHAVWLSGTGCSQGTTRKIETLMGLSATPMADSTLMPAITDLRYKSNGRVALLSGWPCSNAAAGEARVRTQNTHTDEMAVAQVERARSFLSLGHVAITDTIEGHVLCLQMDKPHILVADDSGRNWDFFDTWTRGARRCYFARNSRAAWAMATAAELRGPAHIKSIGIHSTRGKSRT